MLSRSVLILLALLCTAGAQSLENKETKDGAKNQDLLIEKKNSLEMQEFFAKKFKRKTDQRKKKQQKKSKKRSKISKQKKKLKNVKPEKNHKKVQKKTSIVQCIYNFDILRQKLTALMPVFFFQI